MKLKKYILTLLITLMVPVGVLEAKGGRFVPESFDFRGKVESIDLSKGMVVIDDSVFYISNRTRVHGRNPKKNKATNLAVGQYVGFDIERTGSRNIHLYEVWVLPHRWRDRKPYEDD